MHSSFSTYSGLRSDTVALVDLRFLHQDCVVALETTTRATIEVEAAVAVRAEHAFRPVPAPDIWIIVAIVAEGH